MATHLCILFAIFFMANQLLELPLTVSGTQDFDSRSDVGSDGEHGHHHESNSLGHHHESSQDAPRPRKFLYFAYGSNMWSNRIRINNPSAVRRAMGYARGFRLEFANHSKRWKGAVANIIEDPMAYVYGVLWEIDLIHLKSLDRQEGVGMKVYERFRVNVRTNGQTIRTWAYKLTAATRAKSIELYGPNGRPSSAYKNVIIKGAIENKLPEPYIDQLSFIPINDFEGPVDENGVPV